LLPLVETKTPQLSTPLLARYHRRAIALAARCRLPSLATSFFRLRHRWLLVSPNNISEAVLR